MIVHNPTQIYDIFDSRYGLNGNSKTKIKLNQIPICLIHLSNYQTVLKLIGSNKNPFEVLGGYVNDDDSLLRHAISTGRVSQSLNILFNRLFVHIYFKDYLRAKESSEIAEQYKSQQAPGMKYNNHVFYEGLMAFHFSRCPTEKEGSEPKVKMRFYCSGHGLNTQYGTGRTNCCY